MRGFAKENIKNITMPLAKRYFKEIRSPAPAIKPRRRLRSPNGLKFDMLFASIFENEVRLSAPLPLRQFLRRGDDKFYDINKSSFTVASFSKRVAITMMAVPACQAMHGDLSYFDGR